MNQPYEYKGKLKAWRWMRTDLVLQNIALKRGFKCEVKRYTSLIREQVFFNIKSNDIDALVNFKSALEQTVAKYS